MKETINQLDLSFMLWLSQKTNDIVSGFMSAVSFLCEGEVIVIITILGLILLKNKRLPITVALSLALSAITTNVLLKPRFARVRPFNALGFDLSFAPPTDFSFPSGHTTAAFAFAIVFWAFDKRLGFALTLLAALVGLSRLYLLVHYPSDVAAGALIGSVSAVISIFVVRAFK